MEITVALPFLQMSTSHGVGNYFLFMAFGLFWIVAAFAYTGLTGFLSKFFMVAS